MLSSTERLFLTIALIIIIATIITILVYLFSKKEGLQSRPTSQKIEQLSTKLYNNKETVISGFDKTKDLIPEIDIVSYEKARVCLLKGGTERDIAADCFK